MSRSRPPFPEPSGDGSSAAPPGPSPRIDLPAMVLIGAAGRHAGKTLLATRLLEALGRERTLAGAKVTTVHGKGVACPRGTDGCGVCSSLEGPY